MHHVFFLALSFLLQQLMCVNPWFSCHASEQQPKTWQLNDQNNRYALMLNLSIANKEHLQIHQTKRQRFWIIMLWHLRNSKEREKFPLPLYIKKVKLFFFCSRLLSVTDHESLCVTVTFYEYDDTEISHSKDDEINEGRGAITEEQSIIN